MTRIKLLTLNLATSSDAARTDMRKGTDMELNTEKMIGEKEGGIGWMTFNNPERRNSPNHGR